MTINKATIIITLLALELMTFSFRFIKLEPEEKLLPSAEAIGTISNYKDFSKLNSSCHSPQNFNFNQVNLLNSQNINGYNPILPKRLLKIVNASLGRDVNWVETVSLSVDFVDGSVFRLAGVVPCKQPVIDSEKPSPQNNIFSEFEILDDDAFFSSLKNQPEEIGTKGLIILKSDENYKSALSVESCTSVRNPEVKIIGENIIYTKSECDFYYVNPQLFYKGWVMRGNEGIAGEAFPAFGFLQGYKIPAGERVFRFEYKPFLSLITDLYR